MNDSILFRRKTRMYVTVRYSKTWVSCSWVLVQVENIIRLM